MAYHSLARRFNGSVAICEIYTVGGAPRAHPPRHTASRGRTPHGGTEYYLFQPILRALAALSNDLYIPWRRDSPSAPSPIPCTATLIIYADSTLDLH